MRRLFGYVFGRVEPAKKAEVVRDDEESALVVTADWCWLEMERSEIVAKTTRASRRKEALELCRGSRQDRGIRSSKKELTDQAERYLREELSQEERLVLVGSKLDAHRRSKLVGDALRTHSDELALEVRQWLEEQGENVSPRSKTEADLVLQNWKEEPYAKNAIGEAVSLAFQASAGAETRGGLSAEVAAETVWAMQESLLAACSQFSTGDLRRRVAESVRRKILPTLIRLWARTEKASRLGSLRSGLVVERWKREEEQKRTRDLARVPDAKFEIVPYSKQSRPASKSRDFASIRNFLSKNLPLR